jgi:MFS family permease
VSPTFTALRYPNYRLWASGAIVSNTGTWMQRIAQDWLVLTQLTDNSGVAVGITTGLQFAPMLLLAPVAGSVADRFHRRKVLVATQAASASLALGLGLLVVSGLAQLWMVYLFAFLLGTVAAVDAPARQAFVSEIVPTHDLPNAVGLNSASFNAGRLIGPGLAGLLIHWVGTGPVFLINAVSFGAVLISLLRMDTGTIESRPDRGGRGSVRAGLAYVRTRPDIMLIMAVISMVGTFGLNFQITNALMARLEFGKDAGQYGLLGSVMAIGSLSGALLAARRNNPRLRMVIGATFAFGAFSLVSGLMPTYETYMISLIPVGLCSLTLMTAANATVQLSTAPEYRGRVMALYMAVFMGGTPIGSPIIGWVAEMFGPRWTILLGGVLTIGTALAATAWVVRSRGLRLSRWFHLRTGEVVPAVVGTPDQALAELGSPGPSAQAQLVREQLVADERDQVEQGVGDHERRDPAGAPEPLREDHAHHRVPQEGPEPLVEVVGPAQEGAGEDHRRHGPAQVAQARHQVADHDHLLQDGVLDRLQHQHRHRPPVR